MLKLNPACRLHWREIGGDWLVFDEASGLTHQLDVLAACTLTDIEQSAVELPELIDAVAQQLECSADADLAHRIGAIVGQLATLGLLDDRSA